MHHLFTHPYNKIIYSNILNNITTLRKNFIEQYIVRLTDIGPRPSPRPISISLKIRFI